MMHTATQAVLYAFLLQPSNVEDQSYVVRMLIAKDVWALKDTDNLLHTVVCRCPAIGVWGSAKACLEWRQHAFYPARASQRP